MRTSNIVQNSQSSREVGSSAIAMSIDEASSVFLMDALGKLYSRPAQAALREYLSNAIDAHKAKGGKLPAIQITLPEDAGRHSGTGKLLIRDFGKGMNEEEFGSILSRYGASTKRDTNTMIGGFGLGAKSGFAVSDEFFMTSYQSGRGIRVRIFKDNLNQGYIDVVDRFTTKEADGILVEVPIPQSNIAELSKKALFTDFPFFMGYGMDVIDVRPVADYAGQSVHNPKSFSEMKLGNNTVGWLGSKSSPAGGMYGLVGKVAYKIDLGVLSDLARSNKLDKDLAAAIPIISAFKRVKVLDIPIGSVDMPSAREEITYSDRTLKTLGALICNYALLLKQHLQKELNSKKTKLQVVKFLAELEYDGYKDISGLTWKGQSFGSDFFKQSQLSMTTFVRSNYSREAVTHEYASNIKSFRALRHLSDKTEYAYGVFRIDVDSKADILAARKLLTDKVIGEFISAQKLQSRTVKALFLTIPKNDFLSDWVFNGKALDISELEAIVEKERAEKEAAAAKAKAEKLKREAAAEKAQKAKLTRAQSMLSNFIITSSEGKSLTRNTTELVFKDSKVKKYYWSEEEVNNTLLKSKVNYLDGKSRATKGSIHFPFKATAVPNTFTVLAEGSYSWQANYLVKLRAFLRLFLKDGSRVIVLGKDWNLEEFKTTYPDVESAVTLVKESIVEQVKDKNSEIMIAYNAIGDSRWKDKREAENLNRFVQALKTEQAAELSEDIVAASERFKVALSSSIRGSSVDDKYFLAMLTGFVKAESVEKNSYSVEEDIKILSAKYPLLMAGSFNKYSPEIVSHMLDYIKVCDKK